MFLGAMYAIAIVPTGLLMRAVRCRSDGAAAAGGKRHYWIARGKTGSTAQSLEKPF